MADLLLTASRMKTYRACPRRHHYSYDLFVESVRDVEELRFGTLFHAGQEALWLAKQLGPGPALEHALAVVRARAADGGVDAYELARIEVMLCGYVARWWTEPGDGLEALTVEAEFRAPLRNPETQCRSRTFDLAGKLDLVVRETLTGRVLIGEHKTTSEDITPGADYWRRLRMDGQVSTYFAGARALGYDPAACLYDVAKKPGQRPYKATPEEERKYTKATKTEPSRLYSNQRANDETVDEYRARMAADMIAHPDAYFARAEVVRLEGDLEEAQRDAWNLAVQIREASRTGTHVRNPDACSQYGRLCQFFAVCSGDADINDPTLYRRRARAHAELADDGVASTATEAITATPEENGAFHDAVSSHP